jgi:hypothetical protein
MELKIFWPTTRDDGFSLPWYEREDNKAVEFEVVGDRNTTRLSFFSCMAS